jgi:hypothetical protein
MSRSLFKKIALPILIASAVFMAFFGLAPIAKAQDDIIASKLAETKDDVTKLLNLKDDATLSADQKRQMEMDLNRKIISNIIDIALTQVVYVQDQLKKVSIPDSEEWRAVDGYLSDMLEQDQKYYQDIQKNFNDSANITLDDLKAFAKNLNNKKTGQIDPDIQRANLIIAELNTSDILLVTDSRLSKVSSDVSKIYSKNLTKNQALKNLYDQAAKYVSDAHSYDDQARQMIINVYTSIGSTSTKDFVSSLKERIVKNKEDAARALSNISTSTSTSIQNFDATQGDLDSYLANLISKVYGNIKSAYETFVEMSVNINQYLR